MEEKREKPKRRRKRTFAFILLPILILVGAATITFFIRYKATHVSTDDAFVDGRVHVIASKIPGTVRALYINDNQFVKKDYLLVEIDPVDYEVRVKEAQAGFRAERARLSELQDRVNTAKKQQAEIAASLEAARANVELQKANLDLAKVTLQRAESLLKKEVIPRQQYDNAKTAYEVAVAQVKAAQDLAGQIEASLETQRALIKQSESGLPTQEAQIQQRDATLKGAELNLGYTKLYAPVDGYITKRTVETGNQIQAGQPLMAVVPLAQEEIWITANYKETDLEEVKPGQKVKITVDTYPGKVFYGRVNSIMAGTGAIFSLFPPENATGNFVKVVQRIPVKIVLDEGADPGHLLRIGMSVTPTILVHSK
ncbi:MAG: HlyD family secretion protein [Thermodesulfobacteriota bacterium]|jgi:membrane fusion protein (multidrug efflux system)